MENKSSLKEHLYLWRSDCYNLKVRTSLKEITKLLAEDFFEFGSSGTVWRKKDCIRNEGLSARRMTLHDFATHYLAPDVVLTTYRIVDETRMQPMNIGKV